MREPVLRSGRLVDDVKDAFAECNRLRAENEVLKAYARHERSLGAEGPTIELVSARQEIETLKSVLWEAEAALMKATHGDEYGEFDETLKKMRAARRCLDQPEAADHD